MEDKNIEYNSERIMLNDNVGAQSSVFIIVSVLIVLTALSYSNNASPILKNIFYGYSLLANIFLLVNFMKRDFSKVLLLKDIRNIKLSYRPNGNIILRIYNTKGKCRLFDSLNNKEEAQKFIDFARKEELKIIIKENKI